PEVVLTERRLKLKVGHSKDTGILGRILEYGRKQKYTEYQVHLRDEGTEKVHSPKFKLDLDDAAALLYCRHEPIGHFDEELECAHDLIHIGIAAKMGKLLRKNGLWRSGSTHSRA